MADAAGADQDLASTRPAKFWPPSARSMPERDSPRARSTDLLAEHGESVWRTPRFTGSVAALRRTLQESGWWLHGGFDGEHAFIGPDTSTLMVTADGGVEVAILVGRPLDEALSAVIDLIDETAPPMLTSDSARPAPDPAAPADHATAVTAESALEAVAP